MLPFDPEPVTLFQIMGQFGEIRHIDIPTNDPLRPKMSATISGLTPDLLNPKNLFFNCFVQFREYMGFAKCMHDLQGRKLVYVEDDKAWSCVIEVRSLECSDYETINFIFDSTIEFKCFLHMQFSLSKVKLIDLFIVNTFMHEY